MKRKMPVAWAIVALYILFIFSNSYMNGDISAMESGALTRLLLSLLAKIHLCFEFDSFHFFIRKLAHFSEYLVLGALVLNANDRHPLPLPGYVPNAIFMIAIPLCDECLQTFVPGRAGMFTDCLIDMSGYLTGTCLPRLSGACMKAIASRRRT